MKKNENLDVPIVLITFNRPELVQEQIDIMRNVRPQEIYFVSDAPRPEIPEELAQVNETRALLKKIDWDCQIHPIFSEYNMGCDERVVSALNEVFCHVDRAIILEDDCIPCIDFFGYCQKLLERYSSNENVMYISGSKWVPDYQMKCSYGFSYNTGTWGWATWRRAWVQWHWDRNEWDKEKKQWLKGIYSRKYRYSWIHDMECYFDKKSIPWDYVWRFCVGSRLSIFPSVNLISNKGFGENATHTVMEEYGYVGNTGELGDDIIHPAVVEGDRQYPKAIEKQFHVPVWYRIKRKLGLLKE